MNQPMQFGQIAFHVNILYISSNEVSYLICNADKQVISWATVIAAVMCILGFGI